MYPEYCPDCGARDWYSDVLDFHERFGCAVGTIPREPDLPTRKLRDNLMCEELLETAEAMRNGDLPGVADGLVDLIYVAIGTAITYGIDLRLIWNEVHDANMRKIGGATRDDGKILKPEGWQPPNVAALLDVQDALR